MAEIETELSFEARVALAEAMHVGQTPEGYRIIVNLAGGRFEQPRLSGEIIPMSGADWSRIRDDGSGALDVRVCVRTDDRAVILVHWHGVMVFTPDAQAYAKDFARADDPAGADRYYLRTSPRFETSGERYGWLNSLVCVSKSRTGGGVIHRVFAVK